MGDRCLVQDCDESPRRGRIYCAIHDPEGTGPSKGWALHRESRRDGIGLLVIAGGGILALLVVGVLGFRACASLIDQQARPVPSGPNVDGGGGDLSADAEAYLRQNFGDDARWALVSRVEVRSGVLWMYTILDGGEVSTATQVCGLGSAWAYGDPEAISESIWGVTVRSVDGQQMIERNGPSDDCQ